MSKTTGEEPIESEEEIEIADSEEEEEEQLDPETEPDTNILEIIQNLATVKRKVGKKLVWGTPRELYVFLKNLKPSEKEKYPLVFYMNDSEYKGGLYQTLENCLNGKSKISWKQLITILEGPSISTRSFDFKMLVAEITGLVALQSAQFSSEEKPAKGSSTSLLGKRKLEIQEEPDQAKPSKVPSSCSDSIKKKASTTSISSMIARTQVEPVTAQSLITSVQNDLDFEDGCQSKIVPISKQLQRISFHGQDKITSYTKAPEYADMVISLGIYEGSALIQHSNNYWKKVHSKMLVDVHNKADADIISLTNLLVKAMKAKLLRDSQDGEAWEKTTTQKRQ